MEVLRCPPIRPSQSGLMPWRPPRSPGQSRFNGRVGRNEAWESGSEEMREVVSGEGRGGNLDYFEDLEDPRIDRCKRHSVLDIITIGICAVICGADTWVHVTMFGRSKEEWFRTFLDLPNGILSHDTTAGRGAGSLATNSPGWTRRNSRSVSLNGAGEWQNCCLERWWPLTGKRYAAPLTATPVSRPCTWSAPGPRPTP